jgi:hypothetical protein
MEVSDYLHASVVLPLGKECPRCPLDRRLGGPQCRSGSRSVEEEKSLPVTAFEPLSSNHGSSAILLTELPRFLPKWRMWKFLRRGRHYGKLIEVPEDTERNMQLLVGL